MRPDLKRQFQFFMRSFYSAHSLSIAISIQLLVCVKVTAWRYNNMACVRVLIDWLCLHMYCFHFGRYLNDISFFTIEYINTIEWCLHNTCSRMKSLQQHNTMHRATLLCGQFSCSAHFMFSIFNFQYQSSHFLPLKIFYTFFANTFWIADKKKINSIAYIWFYLLIHILRKENIFKIASFSIHLFPLFLNRS